MQDPSPFTQLINQPGGLSFPEQEQLRCPRCDSTNTKFCYYNNYNLSQPRHFCKSCRRYWTKGGALRNIPVGGGTRKNAKRSSSSSSTTSSKRPAQNPNPDPSPNPDPKLKVEQNPVPRSEPICLDQIDGGSFCSLLASPTNVQFGSFPDSSGPLGGSGLGSTHGKLGLGMGVRGVLVEGDRNPNPGSGSDSGVGRNQGSELQGNGGSDSFLGGLQNGWPNLAIYTSPGSRFQ